MTYRTHRWKRLNETHRMGVITHRPWPEAMLQVRGQRLLEASLDALGLPAPGRLRSSHLPIIHGRLRERVGTQV